MSTKISSKRFEEFLLSLYRKMIVKERENLHMSDLDFPRKSFYDKVYGSTPSNEDILRWVRGQSMHSFFEGLFKSFPEVEVEKKNVITMPKHPLAEVKLHFKPDVVVVKVSEVFPKKLVMEFKSTFKKTPAKHWSKRLKRYMAALECEDGVLVMHNLRENSLKCYPIHLSKGDLLKVKQDLFIEAVTYVRGLKKRVNPFPKSSCPKWLCEECQHKEVCFMDSIKREEA